MTPQPDDSSARGFSLERPLPKVYYAKGEEPEPAPLAILENSAPPLGFPEEQRRHDKMLQEMFEEQLQHAVWKEGSGRKTAQDITEQLCNCLSHEPSIPITPE